MSMPPEEAENAVNGYHIIINAKSGAALQMGEETIRQKISESGLAVTEVHFLETEAIGGKLRELRKAQAPVLIAGGDGTLTHAIADFMGKDAALGLLPMGTMNLLARDLDIPVDFSAALAAYAGEVETIEVDVGMVNDRPFMCCAAIGVVPEAARFREKNRETANILMVPRLAMFIFRLLDKRHHFHVRMDGKKRSLRTSALIVSNNTYQPRAGLGLDGFKKESLQDGRLGIYTVVPRSFWDKLRVLLRLRLGNWMDDPVIVERMAEKVDVYTHKNNEKICLDGETYMLPPPLRFSVLPGGVRLLVPAGKKETSSLTNVA
jgi:diacylglycerol kinase family enzyme